MSTEKQNRELTAEEKRNSEIANLKRNLQGLSYAGASALDALSLIEQSTFPGKDAEKVGRACGWLAAVISDVKAQCEPIEKRMGEIMKAPPFEVVNPDGRAAAQDAQAGDQVTP
jgi:hypothetical protein